MNFFNAVLVSLVEPTGFRYAYPLEFTYYIIVAMLPLIIDFRKSKGRILKMLKAH